MDDVAFVHPVVLNRAILVVLNDLATASID
jgi:hypothetical protein